MAYADILHIIKQRNNKMFLWIWLLKEINLEIKSSDSNYFQISSVASLKSTSLKHCHFQHVMLLLLMLAVQYLFFLKFKCLLLLLNKVQQLCQLHTVLSHYCLQRPVHVLLLILPPCKNPKCPSSIQHIMNEITFSLPNLFVNSFD